MGVSADKAREALTRAGMLEPARAPAPPAKGEAEKK
jgi:hypothetical protein